MLTIFTIPKPFKGHIDIIQRNAIESWLRLEPKCEVILCGNDTGVAEVAAEYQVKHIPKLAKTEFGTPLVSSAFEEATKAAENRIVMYTNADIIFLNDLLANLKVISFSQFMMVSQRWDTDIKIRLPVNTPDYESNLRALLVAQAELHAPLGSDWFAFPKDMPINMPPFAVGRPGWDNWLLGNMIEQGIPLINVSPYLITVVHQNHDYAHVPQGDFTKTWDSPESRQNYALIGEGAILATLPDCSYIITQRGLIKLPPLAWRRWLRDIRANFTINYVRGKISWQRELWRRRVMKRVKIIQNMFQLPS